MNYYQIIAFFLFTAVTFITGTGIFVFLRHKDDLTDTRTLFLGECLLLGSILIVGELLLLSLLGLYSAPFLWGVLFLNLLLLFNQQIRERCCKFFTLKTIRLDLPLIGFTLLLIILFFRNSFPMLDVDSHSTYLLIQKAWLTYGTSVFGDRGSDVRLYLPCFDFVPCGLGLSIFPKETLFCQYINFFWRTVAALLVFGYTSIRFNRYYGLAAALLLVLDVHFFYSSVNRWVLINGALISLLFAGAYNFWEGRRQKSPFRFFLAILFFTQILANKYQQAYVMLSIAGMGLMIQPDLRKTFQNIFSQKRWLLTLILSCLIMSLWLIKNYLSTGSPFYPFGADWLRIMGWSPEKMYAYKQILGGISPAKLIKYLNYFFIWPGIKPYKALSIILTLFPLLVFWLGIKNKIAKESDTLMEFSYWLTMTVFVVGGTAIASHQDPRYFRYGMGIATFACIFTYRYIFMTCLGIKKKVIIAGLFLTFALSSYKVISLRDPHFSYPTITDNIKTLTDQLHLADTLSEHYPFTTAILGSYAANQEKALQSAWYVGGPRITEVSAFLLPLRPHVGIWYVSLVGWDSYKSKELVVKDLTDYGVKWIMVSSRDQLNFLTPEEYAEQFAMTFDRYPKYKFHTYTFPEELKRTSF